jgi:hypothetical protein
MTICPFCQFENEDGALFCEQCKSDLGVTEAVVAPASSSPLSVAAAPVEAIPLTAAPESSAAAAAVIVEAAPVAEHAAVAQVAAESSSPSVAAPVVDAAAMPLSPDPTATPSEPLADVVAMAPADALAAAPADRLPPGTKPKLIVVRGQRVNAEYPVYEGDNYIGRADEKAVDIDLEDQEPPDRIWSSRQHALLAFEDGQLTLEDLNSTNGTFVNRMRVHPGQKHPLHVNDIIQIGTVRLKVAT